MIRNSLLFLGLVLMTCSFKCNSDPEIVEEEKIFQETENQFSQLQQQDSIATAIRLDSIAKVEKEDSIWHYALATQSITEIEKYISAYATGRHQTEAFSTIKTLKDKEDAQKKELEGLQKVQRNRKIKVRLNSVVCKNVNTDYLGMQVIINDMWLAIEAYQENCSDGSNTQIYNHNMTRFKLEGEKKFGKQDKPDWGVQSSWTPSNPEITLTYNSLNCTPAIFLTAYAKDYDVNDMGQHTDVEATKKVDLYGEGIFGNFKFTLKPEGLKQDRDGNATQPNDFEFEFDVTISKDGW